MSQFVNAFAIRRWADQITARYTLPQILRRLVFATVKDLKALDFPAHESAQRSGFDGEINCGKGNAWVPDGLSVWEMGVNQDVKGKADDDYDKRTKEILEDVRLRTTYVALTPRHWEHKSTWAEEHRKKGQWKDIRTYDADDLEQWAETAPAIAAWLGRLLGTRPEGVDDIDAKWEMLSTSTSKHLVPAVFFGGREKELKSIAEWASDKPSVLRIETRSPVEGIDFFVAYVASLEETDRDALASRCIVIENINAWKNLRDATMPLILVVDPSIVVPPDEFARAIGNGHHVLVSGEFSRRSTADSLKLKQAGQFELVKALRTCGYSPADAEQHARGAAGSLAILKRRLAKYPASFMPAWAANFPSEPIRGSLLVGGWDERNGADRLAVERLAGVPYAELEAHIQQLSTGHDPLLLHADKKWRVISKDEAWATFGNRVTPTNLAEFEKLAVEILTDDDPRFDLEGDERHHAQILGHVPKYSETMKKHVAITLAMLGALGETLDAAGSTNVAASVDRVVAKLLPPGVPWQRWASLGQYLPMLAEASPRELLRALKSDLELPEPVTVKLFEDEEGFFGRCNHSGLLWALESLAWSKQFVGDVCLALLKLDSQDRGTKWANRPKNSLAEILSGWIPQTMATVGERIQLLDRLIETDAVASWPMLLELLPGARHMSTPTQKPYWRNWAAEWKEGATHAEYREFGIAVAERVVAQSTSNAQRLVQVIERLTDLPDGLIKRFIVELRAFANANNGDHDRRSVSEALNAQLNWLRKHDEDNPKIDEALLGELEQLLPDVQPRSIVQRHAWLFDPYPDHFYDLEEGVDAADKRLREAREKAVTDIVGQMGFPGVQELAERSNSPESVGIIVALTTGDQFLQNFLSVQLSPDDKVRRLVDTFFAVRFRAADWKWADSVLAQCATREAKARLLATLPLCSDSWTRAQQNGDEVDQQYWTICPSRNSELDAPDIEFACKNFLKHDRVPAATELLRSAMYAKKQVSSEILLSTLESLLQLPANDVQPSVRQDISHSITSFVKGLQERTDVDELRLAKLELAFIDVLDGPHAGAPRTLQRLLATHPEIYAQALAMCFRSRNEDPDAAQPLTDLDRQQYRSGYKLLRCLDSLPGTEASGIVNENAFREWCTQLRILAAAGGRTEVCDSYIGQLVTHAPADADGTWPCASVRRVLEEIRSEDLADGMRTGIHNSRGMVARGEGGDQERDLATKYHSFADRVRFTSPFVAQVLDEVAESYEHEGRIWDEHGKWEES
jgi:hypothetical protein